MRMHGLHGDGEEYPTLPMEIHLMDLMVLCGVPMETLPMETGDHRLAVVVLLAHHTAILFIAIKE